MITNTTEFFEFDTMGGAIGYLEEATPNQDVARITMMIAIDARIAGGCAKYRIPKVLPSRAILFQIPTSEHPRASVEKLVSNIGDNVPGITFGISPSGALCILVYKYITDVELFTLGMQIGESLYRITHNIKREEK